MEKIIHDYGVLTYSNYKWMVACRSVDEVGSDSPWLPIVREMMKNSMSPELMTIIRDRVRDSTALMLQWLLKAHTDAESYFSTVPRDILGIVTNYLRVNYREGMRHYTSLLGVHHSFNDAPAHVEYNPENSYEVMQWLWIGQLHREGERPACVTRDVGSFGFEWAVHGKLRRVMERICSRYEANGRSATDDERAECNALIHEYFP